MMETYIGKVCPFCKTEIKEGDAIKICPACGIPHHEACWEKNKGCTTFGCSEQHHEAQGTNQTVVCPKCGTSLGHGQDFCPKCGTPKGGEKRISAALTELSYRMGKNSARSADKKPVWVSLRMFRPRAVRGMPMAIK